MAIDIKIIFTLIATLIGVIAFWPYLRDMFSKKTKPHAYTWLIWSLTQGTAVLGILYGGGSWGALNLAVSLLFVFGVFLLSFKYGTKNITRSDTIILILALCAIFVWWQLHQPLISVIMVTLIDFAGYLPSFRKCYKEPWSETLSSWILFSVSDIFTILALTQYNLLTALYLTMLTCSNLIMFSICFFRRPFVKKPKQ